MKSFHISFRRKPQDAIEEKNDYGTGSISDATSFDVEMGDETALLWLFADFVRENDYEVVGIEEISEVPYDGE